MTAGVQPHNQACREFHHQYMLSQDDRADHDRATLLDAIPNGSNTMNPRLRHREEEA